METHRAEQLRGIKSEPEIEDLDEPVNKITNKRQRELEKGKQVVDYQIKPKTRETIKIRLNSKSLFKTY